MENSAVKTFGKIILLLLVPFVIIFWFFIIPAEENKYSNDSSSPYEEAGKSLKKGQKQAPGNSTANNKGQKEDTLVQVKDPSSFSKFMTKKEQMALDEALKKIDSTNEKDYQKITSIFLVSMGYPSNLITVEYHTNNGANFEGDVQAGRFIPASGKLSINAQFAQYGDKRTITGILRHELDHFDKFAKLCKAIGIENFSKAFGGNLNRDFWQQAMNYADTTDFDKNKYLKAMSVIGEYTDITSFYQIFVDKSNDVRNPFELTAYSFSDYVDKHYKINNNAETNVKKIGKAFNQVDWQIYRIASKNKYLARSRSAIFDYYFLRAMLTYNPNLKTSYQNAVKNGSITTFWGECDKLADGLKNNVLSSSETADLTKILNTMNLAMNEKITNKQINGILQLKYMTLKDAARNSKYAYYKGNLLVLLSINVNDYLDFIDVYSAEDDSMKLKLLTTKYWLSMTKVQKPNGGFYDFTKNESTYSIEGKIKKTKAYKKLQKASGMSDGDFFKSYINKNAIFK